MENKYYETFKKLVNCCNCDCVASNDFVEELADDDTLSAAAEAMYRFIEEFGFNKTLFLRVIIAKSLTMNQTIDLMHLVSEDLQSRLDDAPMDDINPEEFLKIVLESKN